eukprot:scaffold189593_cov24-Attheya_sp.AAC.1
MGLLLDGRLTNVSCNIENIPSPPGSARTMLRSSLSNLCQEVRDVRFYGPGDGVNEPAKDDFDSIRGPVALHELFDRDGVISITWVRFIRRSKHSINVMVQHTSDVGKPSGTSLGYIDKIVHKSVGGSKRPLMSSWSTP